MLYLTVLFFQNLGLGEGSASRCYDVDDQDDGGGGGDDDDDDDDDGDNLSAGVG